MWFDEIEPLLPYIRQTGHSKETDCPLCSGQMWVLPLESDHNNVEFKCFGGCTYRAIKAEFERLLATEVVEENGHEPPEPQAPFAFSESPKKPRPQIKGFTMAELMAMELPEPQWAVPGYLCEGLNILAGAQKLGKSWLVMGTAIAVATGGRALGVIPVEQGEVLCLFLEDTKPRLQDRSRKLLKGADAPEALTMFTDWPRLNEGGDEWLREWLSNHPKTRLVIVDTLKHIRPPRGKGGSFYDEDYDVMVTLKEIADEFGVCLVVVHHVSKAQHEDVFNSVSGSMGLTGAADATLILERPRGSNAGALHITGRDVEEKAGEDAMSLEFCEVSGSWTLKGTVKECGKSDERRQIVEVLELADRALSPKEVSDMLNKNASSVRWLMRKMAEAGDLRDLGGGMYLPPNTPNSTNSEGGDQWWIDH